MQGLYSSLPAANSQLSKGTQQSTGDWVALGREQLGPKHLGRLAVRSGR